MIGLSNIQGTVFTAITLFFIVVLILLGGLVHYVSKIVKAGRKAKHAIEHIEEIGEGYTTYMEVLRGNK